MLYKELVELYEKLDSTSKRLEKIYYLSELIKKTEAKNLALIMLMAQGKIFPDWEDKKIGVASKLIIKAIQRTTGISIKEIEEEWKKQGDLGNVAQLLIKKKKQSSLFPKRLTVEKVYNNLKSLASLEGKGSVDNKINIISELLINSTPIEAKYIIRTAIDNLRVGIGSGSIRDALVWAFFSDELDIKYDPENVKIEVKDRARYNEVLEKVRHAYDLTNDFGKIALILKEKGLNGLNELSLQVGKPINVMLYQKAKNIEDAFSIVGKPAAFEFKYDGFRMQIHIDKDIQIFTRRLENVTEQFPEVVSYLRKYVKVKNAILDAEAVGFDPSTKNYVPFQKISQRIKRKYDIKNMAKRFPVEVNIFDVLYYNNNNLLSRPFKERREILEKIVIEKPRKIVLAKQIITANLNKAQKFYDQSLKLGEEGIMAKNLNSVYKPGSRVGYGVKIKPILEPLDLVIVAAEYGEGKRSGWLTSFYLACSDNGQLKEIGKVSTGLKELEKEGVTFKKLTELLKPLITESSGKHVIVKPKIIIEVGYEEIQKSVNYDSGYALRFPRFLRLRTDEKTIKDINTIDDVKKLYIQQRGCN